MSDKDHKAKPSLFSSLRRSLVRSPGGALVVEETRPMLPGGQRPSLKGPHRAGGRTEKFEISLRDKSDATAKRGFRVQVPKRMLFYSVLVFIVLPLALFVYMEVHRAAASRGHPDEKVPEQHFHHDVLSLLTDEEETDAAANRTVGSNEVEAGNVTIFGKVINKNSTLEDKGVEAKEALGLNGTDSLNADVSNQTNTDTQQAEGPKEDRADVAADTETGENKRGLRKDNKTTRF